MITPAEEATMRRKAEALGIDADLERSILHGVLVHGHAGADLDAVTANVIAGSVRARILQRLGGPTVRVSWHEKRPDGVTVLAGAWCTIGHMVNIIDRHTNRKDDQG